VRDVIYLHGIFFQAIPDGDAAGACFNSHDLFVCVLFAMMKQTIFKGFNTLVLN